MSIVGSSEQISAQYMLKLYQNIVLPRMEYESTVWQIGNCEQLDTIQRKCLALCLGTPATSGIDASEVVHVKRLVHLVKQGRLIITTFSLYLV